MTTISLPATRSAGGEITTTSTTRCLSAVVGGAMAGLPVRVVAGYLDNWPMTEAQKQTILKRDWNGMLQLGGNIYFTAKLAATDGLSFQQIAAMMTGKTQQEYADMMLKGGRSPDGNRSKSEWKNRG